MSNPSFVGVRKTAVALLCVLLSTIFALPAIAGNTAVSEAPADTMVVTSMRESMGDYARVVEDGEQIREVLLQSPFHLIRRGNGYIADLYSDGFKRNDINVTVDGERFTTACPNRMDTRVGQIDLTDIEVIEMSRNSAVLQSGLGGQVDFRRRRPGQEQLIYGQLSGLFDNQEVFDGSLAYENKGYRIGSRYRTINPYTDADGRTFEGMYGYADAATSTIWEVRGHAAYEHGDAVITYEKSEDLLFPYLLMDERQNDHYQASFSYKGHRVYYNRTEHLMDNYLRTSYNMTDMVTDATNTMFGVVGDFYEVYARNWNADNFIIPIANPAMGKTNKMLPDVWRYGLSFQHSLGEAEKPWLFLRLGAAYTKVGEESAEDLYRILEPDAELNKWSFPLGVTASHTYDLGEKMLCGISAEVSSDAPGIEQQFIATDKPGTKPDWVGNPELKDPLRATLRAALQKNRLQLEVFGTRIWEYPYMVKRMVDGNPYQTYEGVDALLAGANVFTTWRYFKGGVNWNWGEKSDTNSPLAEIQPVSLYLTGTSPVFAEYFTAFFLYEHAAGQGRVDTALDETSTGAWNRVDLGVTMKKSGITLNVGVDNLTNVLYTRHLSYLRSPFASGLKIYEPGRTVRASASFVF